MKIKTIWDTRTTEFDDTVNTLIDSGYRLLRREVVPCVNCLDESVFYAELLKDDDREEEIDPVACAEAIRRYCASVSTEDCHSGTCPMARYCDAILNGKTPDEWPLPEGGAE